MLATFLCVSLVGVFGVFLGGEIGAPEIGSVLAIATGVCIVESTKKNKTNHTDSTDNSAS